MSKRRITRKRTIPVQQAHEFAKLNFAVSRFSAEKHLERIHNRRDTNYSYCLVIIAHLRNVCFEDPNDVCDYASQLKHDVSTSRDIEQARILILRAL